MAGSGWNNQKRGLRRFAIPNLMKYIAIGYGIGYFFVLFGLGSFLSLNPALVFEGQIWRIFTFLLIPPYSGNFFFLALTLYFYWIIGTSLESFWGTERFNAYYFGGVLITVICALVLYGVFGMNLVMSTAYINLSMFLAYAVEAPDTEILLFFILPIKMKWLAWFDGAILALTIVFGLIASFVDLPMSFVLGLANIGIVAVPAAAVAAIIGMANFFIYLGLTYRGKRPNAVQKNFRRAVKGQKHKADVIDFTAKRKESAKRGKETMAPIRPGSLGRSGKEGDGAYRHKCAICGRTDVSDPQLEFRYCSKCAGSYEYCEDHLKTHRHVTEAEAAAGAKPELLPNAGTNDLLKNEHSENEHPGT